MTKPLILWFLSTGVIVGCMGVGDKIPEEYATVDYETHVAPLLKARCESCHGDTPAGSTVELTTQEGAMTHALRIHARAVIDADMPPGMPLSYDEKRVLDLWVRSILDQLDVIDAASAAAYDDAQIGDFDAGIDTTRDDAGASEGLWSTQIKPLFDQQCASCHSDQNATKGLNMSTYDGLRAGGEGGPLLDETDPEASLLIDYLRGRNGRLQMPLGTPLTEDQIMLVESWLQLGALESQ